MPAAPGLFSTTTGCCQRLDSTPAMARAMTSELPPGSLGTTNFTGRAGNACGSAQSGAALPSRAAANAKRAAKLRRKLTASRPAAILQAGAPAPYAEKRTLCEIALARRALSPGRRRHPVALAKRRAEAARAVPAELLHYVDDRFRRLAEQ